MLEHSGLRREEFAIEHWVSEWKLANACVLFRGRFGAGRLRTQASAQFVSRAGVTAMIHGFSEYRFGFIRLASVRMPTGPAEVRALDESCDRRRLGVALPFTANNFYHALHHSVPAYQAFGRRSIEERAPTFIPLLPSSAGAGRKASLRMDKGGYAWHAWELSLRAFSSLSADVIASDLEALLTSRCTCFEEILGNSAAFVPGAPTASTSLRAWSDAALGHARRLRIARAGLVVVPRSHPTTDSDASDTHASVGVTHGVKHGVTHGMAVLVRRKRSRVLMNEAAVISMIRCSNTGVQAGHAGGRPTSTYSSSSVRPLILEGMTLTEQMLLIASSGGLVAAHGQALALAVFLPPAARVLEILPAPPIVHGHHVKPPFYRKPACAQTHMGTYMDRTQVCKRCAELHVHGHGCTKHTGTHSFHSTLPLHHMAPHR